MKSTGLLPLFGGAAKVVFLKEWRETMTSPDWDVTSPLSRLGLEDADGIPEGGFGAVAAPAGVGKTALLVQLALHAMLKDEPVLHVSLQDPVQKIGLWYRELFQNLAGHEGLPRAGQVWERILPNRFIMSFQVEGFSVPRLEERISDLTAQNIFHPRLMIVDGLRFQPGIAPTLKDLKRYAEKQGLRVWFTVHVHRQDGDAHGLGPAALNALLEMFAVILKLDTVGNEIKIRVEKGFPGGEAPAALSLDPTSLLLRAS
ncbi:MAG TPA: cytoplasmic protein [Syntrophus sp. (in: bacteria)]|nr:cytoplasmic protein [Syntrophus sp. (in: bacteria)]